jgi:hypothetical protein
LRLLQLWDSITQSGFGNGQQQVEQFDEEPSGEVQYEGRFKIAFTGGHYEVFFVCSSVLFRGVAIDRKEDVLTFLTQPPIDLDTMLVRQAIAAAETLKPTQINRAVAVPDSILRSMGFERN